MDVKEFDVENVARMVEVPLSDAETGAPFGMSVVLVEDANGTRSFWYEDNGVVVIPEYSEHEWELFDNLLTHVDWED